MNFMNKKPYDESYVDSTEIEEMPDGSLNDIMSFLERMQKQMTFLEKKLDMLLSRAEGERSFDGARPPHRPPLRKPYDRPSQRFDHPPRPRRGRNNGEDRDRDRGRGRDRDKDSSRDHYFDRRKAGKKPFHSRFND